jgi:peptidyl-prolyl cis-trans isomerase C
MHKRLLLAGIVSAAVIAPAVFAHPEQAKPTAGKPAAPDSPVEAARRAEVVASYDAVPSGSRGEITLGELEDSIGTSGAFSAQRFDDRDALKALLDRTLRFELLAAEAERRGYDKNASVVQSVKQNAVQSMLKQDIDANVTPQSVSAEAVKKYYDEHIDEFVRPEMRRASQVLLPAEAEAKAVLEQAKTADNRGFRELARLKSQDNTSKLRGGDLRYFDAKGKPDEAGPNLDPALVKAVFGLKTVGDVSGVVKTDAGYAVLKLTGLRPAQEDKLKDAEERIRMRLWREQREAAIDAMLVKLKQDAKPTIKIELLDAIVFAPDAPGPPNAGLPSGFPHTKPPPVPIPKE